MQEGDPRLPGLVLTISGWKDNYGLLERSIVGVTIEKAGDKHRVELQLLGKDGSIRFLGLDATVDSRTGFNATWGEAPASPDAPGIFTPDVNRPSELAGMARDVDTDVSDVLSSTEKLVESGAKVSLVSSNPKTV